MRKYLKLFLPILFMLCFSLMVATVLASSGYPFKNGDVDGDGGLTARDASLVLRHLSGAEPFPEYEESYYAADADMNGKTLSSDAAYILRHLAGLDMLPGWESEEPVVLRLDEKMEITVTKNAWRECVFIAPQAGVYGFISSRGEDACDPVAYDENDAYLNDNYFTMSHDHYFFSVRMEAGETFTYRSASLRYYGGDIRCSYFVSVKRIAAELIVLQLDKKDDIILSNGAPQVCCFTAPAEGLYRFIISDGTLSADCYPAVFRGDFSNKITAWTQRWEDVYYTDDHELWDVRYMAQGETYTFAVGEGNWLPCSHKISVIQCNEAPIILEVDTPREVNCSFYTPRKCSFIAPTDGVYVFYSANNGDCNPISYENADSIHEIDDDSGGKLNYRFTRQLAAGENFTFYTGEMNGEPCTYTVSVSKEE